MNKVIILILLISAVFQIIAGGDQEWVEEVGEEDLEVMDDELGEDMPDSGYKLDGKPPKAEPKRKHKHKHKHKHKRKPKPTGKPKPKPKPEPEWYPEHEPVWRPKPTEKPRPKPTEKPKPKPEPEWDVEKYPIYPEDWPVWKPKPTEKPKPETPPEEEWDDEDEKYPEHEPEWRPKPTEKPRPKPKPEPEWDDDDDEKNPVPEWKPKPTEKPRPPPTEKPRPKPKPEPEWGDDEGKYPIHEPAPPPLSANWFKCPKFMGGGCNDYKDSLFQNRKNCHTFIQCVPNGKNKRGKPVVMHCPDGLLWNDHYKDCDYPEFATCKIGETGGTKLLDETGAGEIDAAEKSGTAERNSNVLGENKPVLSFFV